MALDREEIGKQTTSEHDDETGMREMNTEFLPRPAETFRMRRDQIDEQDCADQMSTGKNRELETATFPARRQTNKSLEITLLRFVDAEMHLRNRAGENEDHGRGQTKMIVSFSDVMRSTILRSPSFLKTGAD